MIYMTQAVLFLIMIANLVVFQQKSVTEIYQYTTSAWYYGVFYTTPPSGNATRVYFPGELIGVQIRLYNEGGATATLRRMSETAIGNVRVELVEAPAGFDKQQLEYNVSPDFQKLPTTGEITQLPSSAMLTIAPGESILTQLTIQVRDRTPLVKGVYRLRIVVLLKNEQQDVKVNNDDFAFEVREIKSLDDQIEMLRRSATAAVSSNDSPETSRKKINELMQVYPSCSIVYSLLGILEYKSGNIKAAIEATEKAIRLLQADEDKMALKYQSRYTLEEMSGNWTASVNAWRRQLK